MRLNVSWGLFSARALRIPTQIGQESDVKSDGVPMQAAHRSD
jgi:hypothetical protein